MFLGAPLVARLPVQNILASVDRLKVPGIYHGNISKDPAADRAGGVFFPGAGRKRAALYR
jgi:hypothetical protein